MEIPERCTREHQENEFQVQDQLSIVKISNPEGLRVEEVTVDGCLFGESGEERCDFLIQVLQNSKDRGNDKTLLVELKGSDIEKACRQLIATHDRLSEHINRHVWWVVSHSGRPNATTKSQRLKERARRTHNARLLIGRSTVALHVSSATVAMTSPSSEWPPDPR